MIVREPDERDEDYSKRVIENGGVIWRCKDCLKEGVIQAEHPLAVATREHFEKEMPHMTAGNLVIPKVDISKDECPYCREEN